LSVTPIDTDVEEWAKKYGIEIMEMKCLNCKKKFKPTIPIAIKGYRGVAVAPHGCPKKYNGYSVVAVDPDEIKFWKEMFP
jgi:hypothetical protein